MAPMRRLRQRVESGGFPLKRIGAAVALLVVAIVALILLTRSDTPGDDEVKSYPRAVDGARARV